MEILLYLIPLMHLLGLFSAFRAVMESRTSQGAIAWVIFLVSMPLIALPAYWILGRSRFVGYRKAESVENPFVKGQMRELLGKMESQRADHGDKMHAGSVAEKLASVPFTAHNRAELLIDGEATFESILAGIDAAKRYVLFQFYIVKDDELGRRVRARLIAKAREGVAVHFLYDEMGSHGLSTEYLEGLKNAGVRVSAFNTRRGWRNKFQLNFRNHRKVVVTDGVSAWIGGHNVGDEYLGRDPQLGRWRDTHMKLTGPAVMGAQLSFEEDWFWATRERISLLSWEPRPASEGRASALVIPTGPADALVTAELMFLHAINAARKRLWIASPYFVPDDSIVYALQLAGMRGVDVRILIPDRADHLAVWLAAFSYFEEAGNTGVKFYRYQKGFLHEKVTLVDDEVATVGTANFDNRSLRLNFEITVVVQERDFVREVEAMFERDFEDAVLESPESIRRKPFWFKVASRLARLSAPIL